MISNPMETRGAHRRPGTRRTASGCDIEANTQGVWMLKEEAFKAPRPRSRTNIQVTTSDVGGGFGTKTFPYPEHIAVGFAARALNRAVKWVADRSENILTDVMGRDHLTVAQAGFDAERRLVALKVETQAGMGAYLSMFGPFIPTTVASRVLPGVYDVQDVFYGVKGVFTNTTPVDAYRGAGASRVDLHDRAVDGQGGARTRRGSDRACARRTTSRRRRCRICRRSARPMTPAISPASPMRRFKRPTGRASARARRASEASGKLRGVGFCYYIESILGDPSRDGAKSR